MLRMYTIQSRKGEGVTPTPIHDPHQRVGGGGSPTPIHADPFSVRRSMPTSVHSYHYVNNGGFVSFLLDELLCSL